MAEEETPNPLHEINKIAFSDADFLLPELKQKRMQVLVDLKLAYKAITENDKKEAEIHYTEAMGLWGIHQMENLDEPELFTEVEKEKLEGYADEIHDKLFPKKD